MSLRLEVSPVVEPLSLSDLKLWLKIEHSDEDTLLQNLISSARRHVERMTRRHLITQEWSYLLSAWPASGGIALPFTPIQSVVSASVTDGEAVPVSVDVAQLRLDGHSDRPTLRFPSNALTDPQTEPNGIVIRLRSGYGDAATDVPEDLRDLVMRLAGEWHERRITDPSSGISPAMPPDIALRLSSYRVTAL